MVVRSELVSSCFSDVKKQPWGHEAPCSRAVVGQALDAPAVDVEGEAWRFGVHQGVT